MVPGCGLHKRGSHRRTQLIELTRVPTYASEVHGVGMCENGRLYHQRGSLIRYAAATIGSYHTYDRGWCFDGGVFVGWYVFGCDAWSDLIVLARTEQVADTLR